MPLNCAVSRETSLTLWRRGRLVSEHFSALDRVGMIRLRESPYYRAELQLDEFMLALQELFPVTADTNSEGN